MRRNGRVAATAALVLIGAAIAVVAARRWGTVDGVRPAPSSDRISIVLVTIDTWRADRLGLMRPGEPEHPPLHTSGQSSSPESPSRDSSRSASLTPRIDSIARGGLLFTQAYTTVPLTLPSHVSMLSGRLPIGHTVRTNDSGRVPAGLPLIAETFRGAGFATGAFVGAAVLQRATGIARGFDEFDDEVGTTGERRCDAVMDRAIAWIDRQEGRPFFLWTHLFDPHLDYDPPEPYRSRFAGRPYDGETAYADACVGRLLDHLAVRGRLDRAAIAVAGDHGEGLGDHGERGHGTLLFDSTIHVPLIVRPPRRSDVTQRIAHPVSTAGLAPTLLRLAGLDGAATPMDVASLVDASGDWTPPAEPVISETLYLRQLLGWSPLYSVRAANEKVIEAPTVRSFDLARDPSESTPASFDTTALLRILRGGLTEALQHGIAPSSGGLDEAQRQRLASLGYVAGGTRLLPLEPVRGIDPLDRIALWDRIERALDASQRGRRADAELLFTAVLHEDPDNALALKFLGALALERASGEPSRDVTAADGRPRGTRHGGRAAIASDLRQAIALHERLVARDLHLADAQANLALAYDRAGRAADAEKAARAALAVDPDHRAARLNLATVLWRAGQTDAARATLDELLRRAPGHAQGLALRDEITRAGHLNGGDPTTYDRRGIEAMRARDDRAAREAFERAVALAPADPVRIERLAALLHRLGDRPAARGWFERAAALAPERPTAVLSLGILDYEDGQAERARRRLEPIRRGWPGAYVAQCYYAQATAAIGRRADARRELEDCIATAPAADPLAARARDALARLR